MNFGCLVHPEPSLVSVCVLSPGSFPLGGVFAKGLHQLSLYIPPPARATSGFADASVLFLERLKYFRSPPE